MNSDFQRVLYEAIAFMGPVASALIAGFAAVAFDGEIYLTPAGEQYLADQGSTS